jgi:CubicO group peptidase (beta-lactamase class C family)
MEKCILFSLLLCFSFFMGTSQTDQHQKIDSILAAAYQPGLSIAYFENGKIKSINSFGVRSNDTGLPVTYQTVFSAASLSKPVLGYIVLQLVDEGKFDIDRPLLKYFEYPDVEGFKEAKEVTARHVLSHQSGLPNWRRGESLEFKRSPGKEFGYSGEGFVWLQRTVEHITGQGLEELAQNRVFQALGMTRTSFIWQDHFDSDYAIPHNNLGKTWRKSKGTEANAAYSLQTTAPDYARFMMALASGKGLSPASANAMFTPQVLVKDYPAEKQQVHWGLGIGLQITTDGTEFWHWGDNGTFKAYTTASTDGSRGIVYFANSQNGLSFTPELIGLYLDTPQPGWTWNGYDHYQSTEFQLLPQVMERSFTAVKNDLAEQGLWEKLSIEASNIQNFAGRLFYENRPADALAVLQMGVEMYPGNVDLYFELAKVQLRQGDQAAARKSLEMGQEKDAEQEGIANLLKQITAPPSGAVEFRYTGHPTARVISLVGSFNDWKSSQHLFQWIDGYWTCRLDLEPGSYHYKLEVDGIRILDPQNEKTGYEDGRHFSILEIKEAN